MLKKAQRVLKGTWSAAITIAVMLISHRIDGTDPIAERKFVCHTRYASKAGRRPGSAANSPLTKPPSLANLSHEISHPSSAQAPRDSKQELR